MEYEIYVSSLPFKSDEHLIRKLFADLAQVKSVALHADWVHPTFEPYAEVLIEADSVDAVVDALDGKKIGKSFIRVHRRAGHLPATNASLEEMRS